MVTALLHFILCCFKIQRRLVLYSFLDASLLDEDNCVQDVARRGFKIDSRGMKVSVGNFRYDSYLRRQFLLRKTLFLVPFAAHFAVYL